MTEEKKQLSTKARNKALAQTVRTLLLGKRDELQRKVRQNKFELNRLAKTQNEAKKLLADVNREMDRLGLKVNE